MARKKKDTAETDDTRNPEAGTPEADAAGRPPEPVPDVTAEEVAEVDSAMDSAATEEADLSTAAADDTAQSEGVLPDPQPGAPLSLDADGPLVDEGGADLHDTEDHEPDHHGHDLDEHGSFPTWLKVMLILLFGAAAALWGGPRIAPLLPSGLAPVARFLEPGSVKQAKVIDDRLSALENQAPQTSAPAPSTEAIDAAVAAALAEYDAGIRSEMAGLSDSVSAVESGDIKTRLAQLETTVEGLQAQMTSLGDQLEATVADSLERQKAMSAEQAASFQARIDGLTAQLEQLAARHGSLQQAIDEVAAANTRIKQEASIVVSVSQAENAATDILAALETGDGFRPALDVLASAVDADLGALQAVADNGAPSLPQIRADFPRLAYESLRASLQADAESYSDKALAFVKSQVATRSLTPQSGGSTDAILSRIEAALNAGNLGGCLSEAEALSEAARAPLAGWLASVGQLADAMAELETATAQIARQKS